MTMFPNENDGRVSDLFTSLRLGHMAEAKTYEALKVYADNSDVAAMFGLDIPDSNLTADCVLFFKEFGIVHISVKNVPNLMVMKKDDWVQFNPQTGEMQPFYDLSHYRLTGKKVPQKRPEDQLKGEMNALLKWGQQQALKDRPDTDKTQGKPSRLSVLILAGTKYDDVPSDGHGFLNLEPGASSLGHIKVVFGDELDNGGLVKRIEAEISRYNRPSAKVRKAIEACWLWKDRLIQSCGDFNVDPSTDFAAVDSNFSHDSSTRIAFESTEANFESKTKRKPEPVNSNAEPIREKAKPKPANENAKSDDGEGYPNTTRKVVIGVAAFLVVAVGVGYAISKMSSSA